MIKHLSYSSLRTYLQCPRQFEYRYLKKLPAVLNGRLIAGRVYHHGVAHALKSKMYGKLAKVEEVTDIMSDTWDAQLSEQVVYDELGEPKVEAKLVEWGDDEPGKLKDTIISLAKLYIVQEVPKLEPVAVEKRLDGIIGGIPFMGYPDCVLAHKGVIDHKFSSKRMSQENADKDIQMSSYATLLGGPIWCRFDQALDQKKLDINVVLTERSQSDINWFARLVEQAWQGIISGIFPPNPLNWTCGEGQCSYFTECRVLMED